MTYDPKVKLNPDEWCVEGKIDGMRLLAHIIDGQLHLYNRSEKVAGAGSRDGYLSALEQELQPWMTALDDTILDGEAVIWESEYAPDFRSTMVVMGSGRDVALAKQRQTGKHVRLAVFDVLRLKGQDTRHLIYDERRQLLEQIAALKIEHLLVLPSHVVSSFGTGGFDTAYTNMVALVEEGAVYKRRQSAYPGDRSMDWLRRKVTLDMDVVITSYEMAKPGKFQGMVGAVKFAQWKDGVLTDRGQCSGMTDAMRQTLTENEERYVGLCGGVDKEGRHRSNCVHQTVLTIHYNGILAAGGLRHAQWDHLRSDKRAEECIWE